jgi:hypothetical protein
LDGVEAFDDHPLAPAIAAFRKWLVAAGSLAETEYPTYLSSNRS